MLPAWRVPVCALSPFFWGGGPPRSRSRPLRPLPRSSARRVRPPCAPPRVARLPRCAAAPSSRRRRDLMFAAASASALNATPAVGCCAALPSSSWAVCTACASAACAASSACASCAASAPPPALEPAPLSRASSSANRVCERILSRDTSAAAS